MHHRFVGYDHSSFVITSDVKFIDWRTLSHHAILLCQSCTTPSVLSATVINCCIFALRIQKKKKKNTHVLHYLDVYGISKDVNMVDGDLLTFSQQVWGTITQLFVVHYHIVTQNCSRIFLDHKCMNDGCHRPFTWLLHGYVINRASTNLMDSFVNVRPSRIGLDIGKYREPRNVIVWH